MRARGPSSCATKRPSPAGYPVRRITGSPAAGWRLPTYMASSRLVAVELGATPLDRYRPVLETKVWADFERSMSRAAHRLRGRVVWNVNSTARGGGVAEMLSSLIPYDRGAGVDARWVVIDGGEDFFRVTKRIHNYLHGSAGDGGRLGRDERAIYEACADHNAAGLADLVRPGDVV